MREMVWKVEMLNIAETNACVVRCSYRTRPLTSFASILQSVCKMLMKI